MLLVVAATEGELRGATGLHGIELLTCGIGPVDAAIAVAQRLARGTAPTALLHVGIAGARRGSGIDVGSLVVGTGATYCDTASQLVTRQLEPGAALLRAVREAFPDAVATTIGTSADVGGSAACDVEAMEGFAVLRAAALAGVPAIEVRAVSNEVEEGDRALWRFDVALDVVAAALPRLVTYCSRASS